MGQDEGRPKNILIGGEVYIYTSLLKHVKDTIAQYSLIPEWMRCQQMDLTRNHLS
jgi:hypothetical protein